MEERRNESLKNFFIYSFDAEHCFTLDMNRAKEEEEEEVE